MAGDAGLDPRFYPPDGKTTLGFDSQSNVASLAIQADNRIVVGASVVGATGNLSFAVDRLTPDGSPDPTFGTLGRASIPLDSASGVVRGLVVQPDGKILVIGSAGGDFAVARLTADGRVDASFGAGGRVTIPFDRGGLNQDEALQAVVEGDGKIVVSGTVQRTFGTRLTFGDFEVGLARLNGDGSPDASFGDDGKMTLGFGGASATPTALAVAADGAVVVAGSTVAFTSPDPGVNPDPGNIQVARVLADGAIDPSFGRGGLASVGVGGVGTASRISVLSDGRIVIGGSTLSLSGPGGQLPAFARLTATGGLDPSFSGDGLLVLPTIGSFYMADMTVQADGRIIGVLGQSSFPPGGIKAAVVGVSPSGDLDPVSLLASASFGEKPPLITRFALQPFGGIIAGGISQTSTGTNDAVVARLVPAPTPTGNLIDLGPPQLVTVRPISTGQGRNRKLTGVDLAFSEPLDPSTVTADRFRLNLVVRRSHGKVTTRPLRIARATYDSTSGKVTLRAAGKAAIPRGAQVVVRPGLRDIQGNTTGGRLVADVRV